VRRLWEIWDGKTNAFLSPSRIVTFLPVQKSFVPAVPKCDVFREGCDKKRHKLKQTFSCARASHSSQKCDACDASHFLSPEKVTNLTWLTQIWDGKPGRNPVRTDPKKESLTYECQTTNWRNTWRMDASCLLHEWSVFLAWMGHVSHTNESYLSYEWVMSHVWMLDIVLEDITYVGVIAHIGMSHSTHRKESWHT